MSDHGAHVALIAHRAACQPEDMDLSLHPRKGIFKIRRGRSLSVVIR
jgi:hypothetical protein